MINIWLVLFFIILLFGIFYWGNSVREENRREIKRIFTHTIQGVFMNNEKSQRNVFKQLSKDVYERRRQGTSRIHDQTWTRMNDRYVLSLDCYAILERDTLTIYENELPIETLHRCKEECKPMTSNPPTYDTIKSDFMIAAVPEEQQDELATYLTQEKHCACINEWNVPIGPTSDSFMSKGLFLTNKKQTSFFFIQPNNAFTLIETFPDIKQVELDVSRFKKMAFAGSLIL
jgi:hypothetical protein